MAHQPKLDGRAKKIAVKLAEALEADQGDSIHSHYDQLRRMLGRGLEGYAADIRKLLSNDAAARLERMTSFKF